MDAEVMCYFNLHKPGFVKHRERAEYQKVLQQWRQTGKRGSEPRAPSNDYWTSCKVKALGKGELRCECSGPRSPGLPSRRMEVPKPTSTEAALDPRRTPLYRLDPNDCFVALHGSLARTLFGRRGPRRGPNYDKVLVSSGSATVSASWVELRDTPDWVELSPCASQNIFGTPGVHGPRVTVSEPLGESDGSCTRTNFPVILSEKRQGMEAHIEVGRFTIPENSPSGFAPGRSGK